MRSAVTTGRAPDAIGPYPQVIVAESPLSCSGQVPIDPATGRLLEEDVAAQTGEGLSNLGEVLAAAGASFADVVKTTVYQADKNDFAQMNAT